MQFFFVHTFVDLILLLISCISPCFVSLFSKVKNQTISDNSHNFDLINDIVDCFYLFIIKFVYKKHWYGMAYGHGVHFILKNVLSCTVLYFITACYKTVQYKNNYLNEVKSFSFFLVLHITHCVGVTYYFSYKEQLILIN